MNPYLKRALDLVVGAAITAALGYLGIVQPLQGSKGAQGECCPIARKCVEGLVRE